MAAMRIPVFSIAIAAPTTVKVRPAQDQELEQGRKPNSYLSGCGTSDLGFRRDLSPRRKDTTSTEPPAVELGNSLTSGGRYDGTGVYVEQEQGASCTREQLENDPPAAGVQGL
jgi:hypothetical protein